MQSRKLEGNCSNSTAINVCKRRLLTCCHLCPCSRFSLSSSANHRLSCVIIYQSPYRKFYPTYRYYLRAFCHTYRYYLRAHFGQIEIVSGILYGRDPFNQKFRFEFPKFSRAERNGIFHLTEPVTSKWRVCRRVRFQVNRHF